MPKDRDVTMLEQMDAYKLNLMSCNLSRPGRFTLDSGRWKKSWDAVGMLTCLYSRVGNPHTYQAVCSQWEAHTLLYTKYRQSQQDARIYCVTQQDSAGPLNVMRTLYWTQSQGYEKTTYQAHSQGYGKLLPLVAQISGWGSQIASIYLTPNIYTQTVLLFLCWPMLPQPWH